MSLLLAIDPGLASGYVVLEYSISDDSVTIVASEELDQYDTCSRAESLLYENRDGTIDVVMESFIITPETAKKTRTSYSLEIIGAVRYLAQKWGAPFDLQTPANAKSFSTNDRLRALDLWVPGGEGHAKDAMRHAVLYLVKNKGWRPKGLLGSED